MTKPGKRAKRPGVRRAPAASRSRVWVSWSRWQKALAVLVPVIVAGVVAGVIVNASGGAKIAVIGPSPTPTVVREAAVTKGQKWVAGRANKLLAAINADLSKLSAAERAGSASAARAAAAKLAADAKAALAGPMPPARAKAYRSALKDLKKAGTDIADGDLEKARRLVATGTTIITMVTAAVNVPAPVNPPPAVNDQNG